MGWKKINIHCNGFLAVSALWFLKVPPHKSANESELLHERHVLSKWCPSNCFPFCYHFPRGNASFSSSSRSLRVTWWPSLVLGVDKLALCAEKIMKVSQLNFPAMNLHWMQARFVSLNVFGDNWSKVEYRAEIQLKACPSTWNTPHWSNWSVMAVLESTVHPLVAKDKVLSTDRR